MYDMASLSAYSFLSQIGNVIGLTLSEVRRWPHNVWASREAPPLVNIAHGMQEAAILLDSGL